MRFIIIAVPRTGSSHLTEKLRLHPDILCHGEVYHNNNLWLYWPKPEMTDEIKAGLVRLRRENPLALLERVYNADYGHRCVGFKLLKGQCGAVLKSAIPDSSIRKVILYRRNVLANYSSALKAGNTGEWSTRNSSQGGPAEKVTFDAQRFVRFQAGYVKFYRNVIEMLNSAREPYHCLGYEDIDDPYLFPGLLNFIGADPTIPLRETRNRLQKQNSTDIVSRFSNPGDVAAFLSEHGLLHWSHEANLDRGIFGTLTEFSN